ncbi:MAG: AAA family ATPase [Candidatus Brocadiia bacterium]
MSADESQFAARLEEFSQQVDDILTEIRKAIFGQDKVLRQLLATVFARGHCLLIGVPGLAKTMMVRTLAEITSLSFKRIQFTPDLMPSDITGTNIIDESTGKREFRFMPGPIFAHIVLSDEINRAPPKTQSALLEAMQEKQVSVGETTYDLPRPFVVVATQNPIEMEGTYPLPEAQLDRFMFNVQIGYPQEEVEEKILEETTQGQRQALSQVIDAQALLNMQKVVEEIVASRYVIKYVSHLVRASRPESDAAPNFVKEMIEWGVGPRAGQYLILGAKAMAAMDGRLNVAIEDIRDVAIPVMRHRIACNFQAQAEGVDSTDIVRKLLENVPEPEIPKYE